jgi:hypothetical protein
MYGSFAVIGFLMFGENTLSQITLNLPKHSIASKVALWTTVTTASRPKFIFSNSGNISVMFFLNSYSVMFLYVFQVINPFTKYPYHHDLQVSVF